MRVTNTPASKARMALYGAALLIVGAVAVYALWGPGRQAADPLSLYPTAQAELSTVSRSIAGDGTVEARETIALFVKSAQKVERVIVKVGDRVEAGDLLITYDITDDRTDLQRRLSEAQLYLSSARLTLESIARPATGSLLIQYESEVRAAEKAIADLKGDIDLLKGDIRQQELRVENLRQLAHVLKDDLADDRIEEEVYDTAYTNYRVALTVLSNLNRQMELLEETQAVRAQQLTDAQNKLAYALSPLSDPAVESRYRIQENVVAIHELTVATITDDIAKLSDTTLSPSPGIITRVDATEGGMASAYAPVIEMADLSYPVVRFEAGEYDAPRITAGQRALLTFPGISDEPFEGTVSKIGAKADIKEDSSDNEVVVPVEITLNTADDRLMVGYSAEVEILEEERSDVIALPIRALVTENGQSFVYVVADGAIIRRPVTIGLYGDRSAEITEGLTIGETYITSPTEVDPRHIQG